MSDTNQGIREELVVLVLVEALAVAWVVALVPALVAALVAALLGALPLRISMLSESHNKHRGLICGQGNCVQLPMSSHSPCPKYQASMLNRALHTCRCQLWAACSNMWTSGTTVAQTLVVKRIVHIVHMSLSHSSQPNLLIKASQRSPTLQTGWLIGSPKGNN